MKNLRYGLLALVAGTASILIWLSALPANAVQPSVQMQTEPALNQAVPDESPVQFKLQAVDAQGKALSAVRFDLQLFTPDKSPWFTSDFPMVEGTTLLVLEALAADGTLAFAQTLPIRGQYALKAQVSPTVPGAFEPFEQVLSFAVPENAAKYRNAAILAGILIIAGLGSGWLVGGDGEAFPGNRSMQSQIQPDEVAPQSVRLLLSGMSLVAIAALLFVNISAELHPAHSHGEVQIEPDTALQSAKDLEIRLSGDQQATVGQLASQTIQAVNLKTGSPAANLAVEIQTVALEQQQPVFNYAAKTDSQGEITWQTQFFDGAVHQIVAKVVEPNTPNKEALQVSHMVEVEAIEPPLYIRLISLSYCTGLFLLSLLIGMIWHRRPADRAVSLNLFRL